jgi:hypothetical protein
VEEDLDEIALAIELLVGPWRKPAEDERSERGGGEWVGSEAERRSPRCSLSRFVY